MRKTFKITGILLGSIFMLILLLYGVLHFSAVQTRLAQYFANDLAKKLHTRVEIGKVDISFFHEVELSKIVIYEQGNTRVDTLAYLGNIQLSVNDNFFFKDSIVLKKLVANDVYLNARRTDKNWNYDFLVDYFSGEKKSEVKKNKQTDLKIHNIQLNHVRVHQKDGWYGEDLLIDFAKFNLEIEKLDVNKSIIEIKNITCTQPQIKYRDYPGNPSRKTINYTKKQVEIKDAENNWSVFARNLQITKGMFQFDRQTERAPYENFFDELHMRYDNIHLAAKNISLKKDSLLAYIHLSTKERCGFDIKKLESNITFTPKMMEFKQLDIITNKSHIGNYYAMRYDDFQGDMQDYVNKVKMEGHLKQSSVHTEDITFFAPDLKELHRNVNIEGDVNGTVNLLKATNLKASSGKTKINGAFVIHEPTDLKTFSIELNSKNSSTQLSEIHSFYPALPKGMISVIKNFGEIRYTGNYFGSMSKSLIQGNFITNIGNLNTDLKIQGSTFTGVLSSGGLNAGKLTDIKSLGQIQFQTKLSGASDKPLELDANIKRLQWDGYTYEQILAKGDYEHDVFNGTIQVNDSNLIIPNWKGSVSLNKEMALDFDAEVIKADLQALGFSKSPYTIRGDFSLHTKGAIPDNFTGEIKIKKGSIENDLENEIELKDVQLVSDYDLQGNRQIEISSNMADAGINGAFSISELNDAFRYLLHSYYPNSIDAPAKDPTNTNFTYFVKTHNISPVLSLFLPNTRGGNNAEINGIMNLPGKKITLTGKIPELTYDGKTFKNIIIQESGDETRLISDISAEDIKLSDSFHLPNAHLNVSSQNDSSIIQLKTGANNTIQDAELNASFQGYSNGFKLHFFPSGFYVNDKKWTLEKDGEFILRKDQIKINDIRFVQGNQSLKLTTELDDESNQQKIIAILDSMELGDFMPLALKEPRLSSKVSGKVILTDPSGNMHAEATLSASQFSVNDHHVGDVQIETEYDKQSGSLTYHAITKDSSNPVSFSGIVNLKDTLNQSISSSFEAGALDLSILTPYLSDIFDDINGNASTSFKIEGNLNAPDITGTVQVKKAALKVGSTKCRYFLENQTITLEKNEIQFPNISIKDSLNNPGTINGSVRHNHFADIYFNQLEASSPKITMLNTNSRDNRYFYGNVIGKASVGIEGPIADLTIYVEAEPSSLDTSHIYIAGGDERETNKVDYIEFVNLKDQLRETKGVYKNNLTVKITARPNPSCKVDVILDEATGDVIKGEGKGLLNLQIGSNAPLSILGNYELTKGEYTFNFQTFLKKPFTLNKGNINWNGDPYNANIDINAEYLAKNVDISSITTNGGFQKKEDIKILSKLTGVLKSPTVKFDFELPEGSSLRRDEIVVKRLAEFKNDDNEMNKQVASLLLFNTFITGNTNFISQGNANLLISNTIGGAVSSLLTNMLNRELEKATRGVLSTYIDINPTLDLQRSLSQLQANIRAGLKISLSNRLKVLLGGNLDYNNPLYTQQLEKRGLLTPDITIEWIINRDGTLRVIGFNRSNIDITLNQRKQSGLQLSYRKDVENLSDILKAKEKN